MRSGRVSSDLNQYLESESERSHAGRRWSDGIKGPECPVNGDIHHGPFQFDNRRKSVTVQGSPKSLTPMLFELLKVFVSNPGKVLSNSELAVILWPENKYADPDDVKQYVYRLRRVIESDPAHPRWLRNVRGFGYQLVVF